MKEYPPFRGTKLTEDLIKKVWSHFKWSIFTKGQTVLSVSPSGGVHYTGKREIHPCIVFEIRRGGMYVMVSLLEYPKGIIPHMHIYYQDMGKSDPKRIVDSIYEELKKIII